MDYISKLIEILDQNIGKTRNFTPKLNGSCERFALENDRAGKKSGWMVGSVINDVVTATFGNWKTQEQHYYCSKKQHELSDSQWQEIEQRRKDQATLIEQEREEKARQAAQEAANWLAEGSEANEHAYLLRKGIKALGGVVRNGGWLDVPVFVNSQLSTLQRIAEDGQKRFLAGGKKKAGYLLIGTESNATLSEEAELLICEGYATACTIYEALQKPVAVAFDAGNLAAVSEHFRASFPKLRIVFCADNDHETEKTTGKNPGLDAATAAAEKVGGFIFAPDFSQVEEHKKASFSDWNDLHVEFGLNAVVLCWQDIEQKILRPNMINTYPLEEDGQQESNQSFELRPSPASPNVLPKSCENEENEGKRESQTDKIVKFVEEHVQLFHDENRDCFGKNKETGEVRRIDGQQFRDWLACAFYDKHGKAAKDQNMNEALRTCQGLARFRGEQEKVFIRVGQSNDCYYLDLGIPGNSQAVEISAKGWQVIDKPPINFVRPDSLQALPLPDKRGELKELWQLVNIPKDSQVLVAAWLCECLRPDTPFPVLELIGEQGSAKSTTQAILRRIFDPNACDLRSAPKCSEDIFIGAGVSWLVSYENISHLAANMQDALCVLATGGGFAKRKLFSDADESVIRVKRPIVLNGISAAVTAQDLVSRTISVETPVIQGRREVGQLWQRFEELHPKLLGGLLTCLSDALSCLNELELPRDNQPRLIEFARLGMGVSLSFGYEPKVFLEQFNNHQLVSIERTLDVNPVAVAVQDWFEHNNNTGRTDTLKNLMLCIEKHKPTSSDAWPKSAKGFGDSLRRAAPALRMLGIECRCLGKIGGNVKWEIKQKIDGLKAA